MYTAHPWDTPTFLTTSNDESIGYFVKLNKMYGLISIKYRIVCFILRGYKRQKMIADQFAFF